MYTNNNNSNNDKDGEEKGFTPLMIKKKTKTMGIKTLLLTEEKN